MPIQITTPVNKPAELGQAGNPGALSGVLNVAGIDVADVTINVQGEIQIVRRTVNPVTLQQAGIAVDGEKIKVV